jgi:hypothetical protein
MVQCPEMPIVPAIALGNPGECQKRIDWCRLHRDNGV